MLYVIWFVFFTVIAWFFGFKVSTIDTGNGDSSDSEAKCFIFSMAASAFALLLTWEVLGANYFAWLKVILPNPGTVINEVTSYFILGFSCILWAVIPILLPIFFIKDEETKND